jgi:hypothetical protein
MREMLNTVPVYGSNYENLRREALNAMDICLECGVGGAGCQCWNDE